MTDTELKKLLKNAYSQPQTEKGRRFIRKYEQRSSYLGGIILNELKYMGLRSAVSFVCLILLAAAAVKDTEPEKMWLIASFLPLSAVAPLTLLHSSERFGMAEIEAASKFSLKFIRLIQMFILGVFSMVVLAAGGIVLAGILFEKAAQVIAYMLIPYLFSIWGGLIITRKWHGSENILGVMAVCIFAGYFPSLLQQLQRAALCSESVCYAAVLFLLAATMVEIFKYINERTNVSWNLC